MSGTLSGLPSLYGIGGSGAYASGRAPDLLATLYGGAGQQTAAAGWQNPVTALQSAEKSQARDVARTASEPAVKRDIAAFRAAVGKAKDATALLSDPNALKVLLAANGLADQAQYGALAKRALLSNPSDPKGLLAKLTDPRWKTVASTYNFATQGLAVLRNPKVLDTLANAYAEVTWRKSLDATTPGLSNALTFRAQAAGTTSVLQILGDPVLREVVTTALAIPKEIAFQSLAAQERAIATRLDVKQLQDTRFVENFARRYLLAAAAATSTGTAAPDLVSLATQARGLMV